MLARLVVGSAAMRQLSHPKSKKCAVKALNILFYSKKDREDSLASDL